MNAYLVKMADLLESEEVNSDDVLESFDCWDSLTILSIIAMLDEDYAKTITSEQITDCKTVGDIYKKFIA